jgi:hypothetical protein
MFDVTFPVFVPEGETTKKQTVAVYVILLYVLLTPSLSPPFFLQHFWSTCYACCLPKVEFLLLLIEIFNKLTLS